MKLQELRIGNIVSHEDYSTETFKVFSIEWDEQQNRHIIDTKGGKNETWSNTVELMTPVPLTKEFLFKLGYWWDEESNQYHYGDVSQFKFSADELDFSYCGSFDFPIVKYVHQLQNLHFDLESKELGLDMNFLKNK